MATHVSPRVSSKSSARFIIAALAAIIIISRSGPVARFIQAEGSPIVAENALTGNPANEWDVSGAGDPTIQGFATDISVNRGATVYFKVNTPSANYVIDIYRLGYYGGAGARRVATVTPSVPLPQAQPPCSIDGTTGLADCGNWDVSASWSTGTAVSGIHVATLKRVDTGGASHIVFVVRDDARQADVVVQTSDTTWQAYNQYGGGSLYCNGPVSNEGTVYGCIGRATKVSYNRPFDTRAHDPQSFLFNAEYPMVRWLEANGYDVKYISGVDTERNAGILLGAKKPKAFVAIGHDEYWSAGQRATVEAARDAGVSLAFFSGNEIYWKTRFEPSADGSGTPYRTLVSYKDTLGGVKRDPLPGVSTGTWRDLRFSPPVADGGLPENSLTGTLWTVNSGTTAITVPASMAGLRFWRNTRVASLTSGSTSLGTATLGYEWDEDIDNGSRPSGLMHLSSTTVSSVEKILDFGETVGIGTATHHLTMYRVASGALVFGAGTVQWAWGLDGNHDRGAAAPDDAMQQATVNLFADMGAQPGSLQNGLVAASKSTDTFGPTSSVTSPVNGGTVGGGDRVTITGTAADSGGVVAGVEVSVDGGATWRAAQGTSSWSFEWMAGLPGSVTILSRAVDDSGNRGEPGAGITVSIVGGLCPCPSLWTQATVPPVPDVDDPSAVELGLKFRSGVNGFVTGVRFYKSTNNTGTHIGNLWTSTGTRLATATFAGETPSGWQQVLFDEPVPVTANTTYVVSYHTNVGHYAASGGYLSSMGVDAPPLQAPTSAAAGGNGLFLYGPTAFPTQTFNATNYWVDVVFDSTPDATAPSIADVVAVPLDGATAIVTWTTDEQSTSSVDYSTEATFLPETTQTVSDVAYVTSHHVTLTGLRPSTSYFFRVRSTDRSGNMASKPSLVPAPPPPQAFTMPSPTLRDTMPADFAAGVGSGTYVAESGDGELTLTPSIGAEFSGTTMPSGWKTHIWSEGGTATVGGGRMTADGVRVTSCVDAGGVCQDQFTLAPGTSLEFVATFTGDPYQHSGLGRTLETSDEPFALFSTLSGGSLNVRTYTGDMSTNETVTNLGTALVNSPHRYRIDWQASQVVYSVDGVRVATHPVAINGMMRPVAASDYNAFSGKIVVDWIHVSPFTSTSGTFQSRIFDAGLVVNWGSVEWTAATPAGTSLAITVCTSNTLAASGSLENPACTPVIATSPQGLSSSSRYVQYRADLATGDAHVTPELSDIRITGSVPPIQALITPEITWATPANIAWGTALGAAQLNATTNVPADVGTLTYAPPAGTVLEPGPHTVSVTFTPEDPTRYRTATASVSITVEKATPAIVWAPPAPITYPAALGAVQLNATSGIAGSFVYTPAAGTVLAPGARTLSVMFTPADSAHYTTAAASVPITVQPGVTTITWANPAAILAGTPLGATQLKATANVAGTFVYTPPAGTILPAGPNQPLSVAFTPTDKNYGGSTKTVSITVLVPLSATDVSITEGSVVGATKQAWITVKLGQKSTAAVEVRYTTSPGTASANTDYLPVSGALYFAPGVLTQSIAIPIIGDTTGEPTEQFYVDFSGVLNAVPGSARATVTIVNDDSSSQVTTSSADFSAGTLAGGAYIAETTDGELMAAPRGSEFSGTTLPVGWTLSPLSAGASAVVGGGMLSISGAGLLAPFESAPGQTLEFVASFTASANQAVGLGKSSTLGSPMAMFVVGTDGELYARSVNGARVLESAIAGVNWLGTPRRYQIVWSATTASYYIDGTLMISHGSMGYGTTTMKPVILDSVGGDGVLGVDWIRMTPYASSGSFTSVVFDAGAVVLWQKLTRTATIPTGTSAVITYRRGDTPVPDASWTTFATVPSTGTISGSSRYVQFVIQISSSSTGKSPVIQDVTVQYKR